MGRVTVRFWGTLRLRGPRTLEVEVPASAVVQDVVTLVAAELGGDAEANARDMLSFCLVLRNGEALPPELGLGTPVADGDVIAFVPAASGG